MKGMNFPLDFIWIRENKVVDITENAPAETKTIPSIYKPKEPVDMVLEVNAGVVKKDKIKIGDIIELIN
jgi:uncharacterized membrane protein (UPF0127 family)